VLGGRISPLDGIGPDDLHVDRLLARCERAEVREVIVATNPSMEGEATATYSAGAEAQRRAGHSGSRSGCPWAATSNMPTR